MRVLASLCALLLVAVAFVAGGCPSGSGNCISDGGACGAGATLSCCSGLVCFDDGNFEYCTHPSLTTTPRRP
jgi:hypothetical protein